MIIGGIIMKKILSLILLLGLIAAGCATTPSAYKHVTNAQLLAEYKDMDSQIKAESGIRGNKQKAKTLISWKADLLEEIEKRDLQVP